MLRFASRNWNAPPKSRRGRGEITRWTAHVEYPQTTSKARSANNGSERLRAAQRGLVPALVRAVQPILEHDGEFIKGMTLDFVDELLAGAREDQQRTPAVPT